jgi:hypothetical protein
MWLVLRFFVHFTHQCSNLCIMDYNVLARKWLVNEKRRGKRPWPIFRGLPRGNGKHHRNFCYQNRPPPGFPNASYMAFTCEIKIIYLFILYALSVFTFVCFFLSLPFVSPLSVVAVVLGLHWMVRWSGNQDSRCARSGRSHSAAVCLTGCQSRLGVRRKQTRRREEFGCYRKQVLFNYVQWRDVVASMVTKTNRSQHWTCHTGWCLRGGEC